MFNVGDVVKWKSQAGGRWKTKRGKVIAVVPAGMRAGQCIPPNAGWRMKKGPTGQARKGVSYLVNPETHGTELLWPVASGLTLVSTAGITQAMPTAAPAPVAEPDDGMEACIGCGARLLSCDLDADGMCSECLEKQEKAIAAEESEEAKKA